MKEEPQVETNIAPVELEIIEWHGMRTDADGWQHYAYDLRLSCGDESMRIPWRAGVAAGEPTAADVLECVLSDAASFINAAGFDDWAEELGFDTDSRKAYAIWEQTEA